jgi:hypothetical protein
MKDDKKLNTTLLGKKLNETINTESPQQDNNLLGNKHYYFNKDSKMTIKTRDKSDLLNFTSALNTQES